MKPTPQVLLDKMTEAELQATLIGTGKGERHPGAFQTYGYIVHHETDSRRTRAGFPDVVAVHPVTGWMFVLELKSERGRVRPEQVEWLHAMKAAAQVNAHLFAGLIRPRDLDRLLDLIRVCSGR